MAAEAVNEQLGGCMGCSPGLDDLSSFPGFEGKKVPTITIREIAPGNAPAGNTLTTTAATVAGTQRMRLNSAVTLDIRDPFSGNAATSTAIDTDISTTKDREIAAVIANLSRDGYDLTGESSHRYESTVTSDDFLALNSSQKTALANGGVTLIAGDTVRSYRDVTYYTFTSRTTQAHIYMMAIQRLDTGGNPIGNQALALSPEFPASGAQVNRASSGAGSTGDKYCLMEWSAVILLAVGLITAIVVLVFTKNPAYSEPILDGLAFVIGSMYYGQETLWSAVQLMKKFRVARRFIFGAALITGILLLFALVLSIDELGRCMGWWGSGTESVWSYQYHFTDADNGKVLPLTRHDRFALALFADTRVDKDAHWMVESHPGLEIREELVGATENGTIQSWLVEVTEAGSQKFTLTYKSKLPVPPTVAGPYYSIGLQVATGTWNISTVDETDDGLEIGGYPSFLIDRSGTPRISYYDDKNHRIMYAQQTGNSWKIEPVADSAGTYSTSLALSPSGDLAISFGDSVSYGNLMYAIKNGTRWDISKIDRGIAGDAGEYSSLAFDASGRPHITYNDGQDFASLKYALYNGKDWEISNVDTGGLTGDTGYSPSLVIDTTGHSHVAYTNGNFYADLMYATDKSGNWTIGRVDEGGGRMTSTGFDPSLALDSKDIPHVSYYDASGHDLRYASWNGTLWNLETVDNAGDVGRNPSLAIDSKDIPHISYYDASNGELRYATYDATFGHWVIRTVDNEGNVGDYSSLALNPAGYPCIAYYDATNHVLKYAGWTG